VIVPRHLAATPSDPQVAMQRCVLDVLAQQVMLDGTANTSMELRRLGLEALPNPTGRTPLVGWETIFEARQCLLVRPFRPRLAIRPFLAQRPSQSSPLLGYLQEKGYSTLIKIAFQCMTLMCDAALSPEHLRLCISTLQVGQFGRQADTNIALMAVESLFWGISDTIQAKCCKVDHEPAYSAL
jgi:hypothetical protein